ncbi:MAG: NTP transferase domain-containing protein [candidate division Zixibacteria bacterium]|nr:NTP transferase domain-containing protein [candidate division Zixibacteria bacterium]
MKVIIPVAGIGTRLRPHTHTAPKALLYVAGKPLLGHILDSIKDLEFEEVTFVIGFMGDKIIDYVNQNYDFKTRFVEQKELLGLGHAINMALDEDEEDEILAVLGDTIVEMDWDGIIGKGKNFLGVRQVDDPRRFGVAEVDGDRVLRLLEKPPDPPSNLALVGVYYIKDTQILKKSLNKVIESDIKTKNEYQVTDAFQVMLEKGAEMYTYEIEGWYDCGKPETLLETNRHLLDTCKECAPEIEGSAVIPPVFVDKDAKIENSIIGPYASVAAGVTVKNSIIKDSIISVDANISSSLLESSLIGNSAEVQGHFRKLNVGDSSQVDL